MGSKSMGCLFPHHLHKSYGLFVFIFMLYSLHFWDNFRICSFRLFLWIDNCEHFHKRCRARTRKSYKSFKSSLVM